MSQHPRPEIDPERPREETPFDRDAGYSGQDYDVRDEAETRDAAPAGTVAARPADAGDGPGARASFDPETGAVRGSGAGPTEEIDTDDPTTGLGNRGGAKG